MTPTGTTAPQLRQVETSRAWPWFTEAYDLFRQAPGTWIGMLLIYIVINMAASAVHGGSILTTLFSPVFSAGLILAAHHQASGDGVKVEHLFAGFSGGQLGDLIILALLNLAAFLVLGIIGVLIALLGMGLAPDKLTDMDALFQNLLPILLVVLILIGLYIPVLMGMWLSPALIVLHKLSPVEAFKTSFKACTLNFMPLLVYGLIAIPLAIVATIPFFLGWLIAAPIFTISIYTAYRDMFPPAPDFAATQPIPVPPPL